MKRRLISACMLILILAFSFSLPAYAANTSPLPVYPPNNTTSSHADWKEYTLGELGLIVPMPLDYVVFTRDTSETDPNLSAFGYTKESLSSSMTSNNIYLEAWDKNKDYEVYITMKDSSLKDFNQCSNTELSSIKELITSEFEASGITCSKPEVYLHGQTKFLMMYESLPNGAPTDYGIQYYTVYRGKEIRITMNSYNGQDSADLTFACIVENLVFVDQTSPAFTYTDPKTQTTFTVPANWVESSSSEPDEYIDVQYISSEDPNTSITYYLYDAWEEMTESERAGGTRSDMDINKLTKDKISECSGISTDDISTVTYGGTKYYKTITTEADSVYGTNTAANTTLIFTVVNGYVHAFMFSGTSDSELYDDFETLLNSVEYNTVSSNAKTDTTDRNSLGSILISWLFTIVLFPLPIIIYRYVIRRKPVEPKNAKKITIIYAISGFIVITALLFVIKHILSVVPIILWSFALYQMLIGGKKKPMAYEMAHQAPILNGYPVDSNYNIQGGNGVYGQGFAANAPVSTMPENRFCRACGNRLELDSAFCSQCGTPVVKE